MQGNRGVSSGSIKVVAGSTRGPRTPWVRSALLLPQTTILMDATSLQHHDGASSQRESDLKSPTQDEQQERMVTQLLAHFDPLARLEAEYAAVLAQSSAEKADRADSSNANQQQTQDGNDDEADGEYTRLPTSPGDDDDDDDDGGGGEYYQPLGDASDSESDDGDRGEDANNEGLQGGDLPAKAALSTATPMDAAKRETIMKSMQRMQLAPPPWAHNAKLSDDELFAMVRDRLEQ